jgi:signal transduction histidine kinase
MLAVLISWVLHESAGRDSKKVQCLSDKGRIGINTRKAAEAVEVMIMDNGSGIPLDELRRVF